MSKKIEKGCCYCRELSSCPQAFSDIAHLCGAYDHSAAIMLCNDEKQDELDDEKHPTNKKEDVTGEM